MNVKLLSPLPGAASGNCRFYLADHRIFGSVVAKVWTFDSDQLPSHSITEPLLQSKLQHKNVCGLLDTALIPGERQSQWVLCLERYETDLQREIQRRGESAEVFSEVELWEFLVDMTDALASAQVKVSAMQHIAHRDIKPSNILIAFSGDYKLADFGEAKMCANESRSESVAGTKGYLSPLLRRSLESRQWAVTHNPFRSDVFSFGLTALSMACLRVFKSEDSIEQIAELVDRLSYSDSLKSVLRDMLKENESDRPDFIALKEVISERKESSTKDTISDDEARASVFGCFPSFYEKVRRLLRDVANALFSMWKLNNQDSVPVLQFYCKKQELLESLATYACYETKHTISNYEFEYIPVFQLISPFSNKSVLTIEQKTAESFTEIQSLAVPNCMYSVSSPENEVKFQLRKSGSVVTISEPPAGQLSLAVQLPPNRATQLLQGQVYCLGTIVLKVVEVSSEEIVFDSESSCFQRRFGAGQGDITIGRDQTNIVALAGSGLSKVHAVVKCEQGVWTITDLQSRNGSWMYCHTLQSMHRQSNEVRVEEGAMFAWNADKYRFRVENNK